MVCESSMALFSAIFALWDVQVYVCFLYSSNEIAYVEASVDETLSLIFNLDISYVHLYNYHIHFGQCFDNPWLKSESHIIEYMHVLDYSLNNARVDQCVSVFH